jgi:F420-dependent methylenetetrahydromethanopterin dehydrogenase
MSQEKNNLKQYEIDKLVEKIKEGSEKECPKQDEKKPKEVAEKYLPPRLLECWLAF